MENVNLIIKISKIQEDMISNWMGKIVEGHINEELEPPSGVNIVISIDHIWGDEAEAVSGSQRIDLGSVEIIRHEY